MLPVTINFPAFCFNQGTLVVVRDEDEFTTCTSAGLHKGWYDGLRVVDLTGNGFLVRGAKVLHGVGLFGGFDIFLNRKLKVELDIQADEEPLAFEELRKLILKSFRSWHGWASRGDLGELKARVEAANTTAALTAFLHEELGS